MKIRHLIPSNAVSYVKVCGEPNSNMLISMRDQRPLALSSCRRLIACAREWYIDLVVHISMLFLLLAFATACRGETHSEHATKVLNREPLIAPLPSIPDEALREYIESLARAAASSPTDSEALGLLAMTYDANGFDRAAERTYRIAVEQATQQFKWRYLLSLRLHKNGDLKEAIQVASNAIQHNRTYPAIYIRLGNWLLDDGQPHAARDMFERALEIGAGPAADLGVARALLKSDDFETALERLESVVSRSSHPMAFRLLGDTWRALGETEKSREYLAHATLTKSMWFDDPLLGEMLTHARGKNSRVQDIELMLGSGLVDDALTTLHELEAEGINDVNVQYRFALAYFQNQSFDLAKQRLMKAIELEPVHYPSHLLLASLYQREEDNVKAAAHLENVLTIYPKLQIAHQELGFVRLRLGDTEGALNSFEHAIELDSNVANVHYYAGIILGAQGSCEHAIGKFETALLLDSNHEKARMGLLECVDALNASITSTQYRADQESDNKGSSFD